MWLYMAWFATSLLLLHRNLRKSSSQGVLGYTGRAAFTDAKTRLECCIFAAFLSYTWHNIYLPTRAPIRSWLAGVLLQTLPLHFYFRFVRVLCYSFHLSHSSNVYLFVLYQNPHLVLVHVYVYETDGGWQNQKGQAERSKEEEFLGFDGCLHFCRGALGGKARIRWQWGAFDGYYSSLCLCTIMVHV
ncbi:hypothetical protein QBC46DRAFT_281651 [Diplogelasinospora grovesii]|uniref:Uncharacterized protein n=1 Tax=Diplogelasinospora grovesii TaxID=303347 RepID=A0AAN6NDI5_9PEZI|nr:hypothetical protein QBC46DRAFT_281651 [Diplogelasinospora grovesii]